MKVKCQQSASVSDRPIYSVRSHDYCTLWECTMSKLRYMSIDNDYGKKSVIASFQGSNIGYDGLSSRALP